MKTTIASVLISNAIEFIKSAQNSNNNNQPDDELRNSIGAHLMIALAIEGIGNEVGEIVFNSWQWLRIEKTDTPLKWYLISGLFGKKAFEPNKEPLQTIQHLHSIRNRIAHPKIIELGSEIIIRTKNGTLLRNVKPDYILKEGDHIWAGVGKLLDEFNFKTSYEIVKKSILAIKKLRNHLSISGLEWVDDFEKIINKIKKTA